MQYSPFKLIGAAAIFALAGHASAGLISPTFDTFGSLPAATFGGNGIPNNAVAIATAGTGLTIGLTAHQRYIGPNLTNDGQGTYTALAGVSPISPSPATRRALMSFVRHSADYPAIMSAGSRRSSSSPISQFSNPSDVPCRRSTGTRSPAS